MKKLIVGLLAAWMTIASGWAVRAENAIADKYQNKGMLGAYDIGTGQLIPLNIRLNGLGDQIVDGGTNTFTVMGVSLDAIEVAVEAIEGIGNTILATNLLILDEATTIKTNTQLILDEATTIKTSVGSIDTKMTDGTDIGDTTNNNAAGTASVNTQGADADGAAATARPVAGGGVDQDGNIQTFSVCKDGATFIKTDEVILDDCDATTGFTGISDAASIATSTTHIAGSLAVTWDKTGGSNVLSAVQKTVPTTEIILANGIQVGYLFYIPDGAALADIEYSFIRVGEDSSNYLEFQQEDINLIVGWNSVIHAFVRPTSQTGNGTSTGNAKYVAIGCETDDAADTISGLIIDDIVLNYLAKTAIVEAVADVLDLGVVRMRDGSTNDRLNIELDSAKNAAYVQSESMASAASQDAMALQLGVIEGNGTTLNVTASAIDAGVTAINTELDGQSLQLGVIEGNGTTGVARLVDILAEAVTIKTNTGLTAAGITIISGDTSSIDAKMVSGTDIGDVTINNATGAAGVYTQGGAADGAAAAGNPQQMGGVDEDGNAQAIAVSGDGAVEIGQHGHDFDTMEAVTGWAAVQDAANIATSTTHIEGTLALEWDKTGGSNVLSALEKTITTVSAETEEAYRVSYSLYLAALTDMDYAILRLGEDDSNYLEWQTAVADLVVGWNALEYAITNPDSQTGAGLSTSNFKYALVGIATDDAGDTVNDFTVDNLRIDLTLKQAPAVSAIGDVEIGTVVLKDWNSNDRLDIDLDGSKRAAYVQSGSLAAESGGNLDDIATDTGTIDADTSILAAAVAAGQYQVDVVAELPAGTQLIGSVKIDDGGTIDHKAVTTGVGPTLILGGAVTTRRVTIINADNTLVAIGASDVTLNSAAATDGFVLAASNVADDGTGGSLTIETEAAIYGKGTDAGSKVIIIFESD